MSDEIERLRNHVATLERHVAKLESVILVLLEEIEAGRLQESVHSIREALRPLVDEE